MFFKKNQPTEENIKFKDENELEQEIATFDPAQSPTSTTLSPHDLYLLLQCNKEPIQVVFGNVVYSMGVRGLLRSVFRALTRGEMVDFSRLNRDARELARNRMVESAKRMGATDVVGVKIEVREYADFMEVVATGTAVKPTNNTKEIPPQISVAL